MIHVYIYLLYFIGIVVVMLFYISRAYITTQKRLENVFIYSYYIYLFFSAIVWEIIHRRAPFTLPLLLCTAAAVAAAVAVVVVCPVPTLVLIILAEKKCS